MTIMTTADDYGVVSEDATLTLERLLPGPIDRIWSYLVDSDLRRQWLAAGAMEQRVGAPVDLVWRNDELTDPPGTRPDGMDEEHRLTCEVLEIEAPQRLAISWGSTGGVTFTLQERGADVLLTVTHRRVADPAALLNVSAGWHSHVDVLEAKLRGIAATPHWDNFVRLRGDYTARLAG